MATNLIDTTVLIDLTRGRSEAVRVIADEQDAGRLPVISIVSSMELIVGCRDKAEVRRVQDTLARFSVLPLTPSISRQAYEWLVQFSKSHGLMIPDALIAATAMESSLGVLTLNERHFAMLPGMAVQRPY
jgi:predicted nucleic acid-binding protein